MRIIDDDTCVEDECLVALGLLITLLTGFSGEEGNPTFVEAFSELLNKETTK